jgi:uncharacterized protein (DUF2147 family)
LSPPASAAEPIVGRWNLLDGVVDIVPDGVGGFKANQIKGVHAACPDKPFPLKLSGSGTSYTGTVSYYDNGGCGDGYAGEGSVTVDVALTGSPLISTRNHPRA